MKLLDKIFDKVREGDAEGKNTEKVIIKRCGKYEEVVNHVTEKGK